jgi:hypothetical protein
VFHQRCVWLLEAKGNDKAIPDSDYREFISVCQGPVAQRGFELRPYCVLKVAGAQTMAGIIGES